MRSRSEPLKFAFLCAGIIAFYFWTAYPAVPQYGLLEPSEQHFNQLVAGFRSGQLSLKRDPPPELARLADPYDPAQNARYRLQDASYYRGKFYIYYGITPALVLFWPYVALTGHYLAQKYAVAIFCSAGFAFGAALAWLIRSAYFPRVGTGVFLAMVLAVGAVNGTPFLARRPEMYEVAISSAYAMVMAALSALWFALHDVRRPLLWTALSSLFFGLAVGSRPTFLFGSAALALPVAYLLRSPDGLAREETFKWRLGMAALLPLGSIGIGLALYNYLRFGNPLEFGIKYLMMGKEVNRFFAFNGPCAWLNVRFYFLLPTRLGAYFPFVRGIDVPPFVPGYAFIENPFGVFPNIPFLLLAGAAPLAWGGLAPEGALRLRLFAGALAWIFITSVVLLLGYVVACMRYEVDFAPYLAVLAVLGVFGIEARLSSRPRWRGPARAAWSAALAASVAFNLFGSCWHLGVLKRDAPGEFQALSRLFDYPNYAYNRLVASVRPGPGSRPAANARSIPGGYGPISLRIILPREISGKDEPLLVIGNSPEDSVIAFVRRISADQFTVGFEFPGRQLIESRPIWLRQGDPVDVAIVTPPLLPHLGDREWNGAPYGRQLSDLGRYAVTVDGVNALEGTSPLDGTVDREARVSIGVNPVEDSLATSRFSGRVTDVSRLAIGEGPSER
jgi:hypothetical protein